MSRLIDPTAGADEAAADPQPRPLRVGIIGAGNIARNHVEGYRAAGAEVVAHRGHQPGGLARPAPREWCVAQRSATSGTCSRCRASTRCRCAPPTRRTTRRPSPRRQAGIHVLCEKPISLSLVEADEMIAACREAGVVLQVDHHLRSNRAVQRARRIGNEVVVCTAMMC